MDENKYIPYTEYKSGGVVVPSLHSHEQKQAPETEVKPSPQPVLQQMSPQQAAAYQQSASQRSQIPHQPASVNQNISASPEQQIISSQPSSASQQNQNQSQAQQSPTAAFEAQRLAYIAYQQQKMAAANNPQNNNGTVVRQNTAGTYSGQSHNTGYTQTQTSSVQPQNTNPMNSYSGSRAQSNTQTPVSGQQRSAGNQSGIQQNYSGKSAAVPADKGVKHGPGGHPGQKGGPPKAKKGTLKRLISMLFREYRNALSLVIAGMIIVALVGAAPSVFIERITSIITEGLSAIAANNYTEKSQFAEVYHSVAPSLLKCIFLMIVIYIIGLAASFMYNRMNAVITQGFLYRLRKKVFAKMQSLPVKYFDTHNHGDIMSYYTNDIDSLRQLLSQALPNIISSALTVIALTVIMLYYSVWLTITIFVGVFAMMKVVKYVGGNSAKYFMKQQISIGKTEGFIEEMIHGQKVVKVFCHEDISKSDFDRLNEELFNDARNANKYANILMPIMGNIGNIMYVVVAFIGGLIAINGWANPSLRSFSGGENILTISVIVTYLSMTRQFCQSIAQVSNQINAVAMALAGASRIFDILDEEPEQDDGYVELVNAVYRNGQFTESTVRTGVWAWKHQHGNGSVSYTPLQGNIVFDHVDFGYVPEKSVLNDISLYAHTGQKIALVGSTGAGKTTITNLINRFYDIQDGKIRYDDININKIKKNHLRRSLGVVLQDVNLFTGTVLDNIRYGNLEATDEECIAAARLANADDFIRMLPDGYRTVIKGDGSDLSQGQRQLISIARAAIANPPLMILDEATSSIDTRTELIVQKGMDALMKGRTVFVIAHRLSTIRNSDVILVLEQGRIIERGSHDQLIAQQGTYYRLYTGAFELK